MKRKKSLEKRSLKHLRPFILENCETSWQMELIMILCRDPSKSWTSAQLSEKLLIECSAVDHYVFTLIGKGLVTTVPAEGAYRYMPDTAEKNALVELLVSAFARGSLQVMRMIYESE